MEQLAHNSIMGCREGLCGHIDNGGNRMMRHQLFPQQSKRYLEWYNLLSLSPNLFYVGHKLSPLFSIKAFDAFRVLLSVMKCLKAIYKSNLNLIKTYSNCRLNFGMNQNCRLVCIQLVAVDNFVDNRLAFLDDRNSEHKDFLPKCVHHLNKIHFQSNRIRGYLM